MSSNNSKPTLFWWISLTVAAFFLVFMAVFTVRSIANIFRAPAPPPSAVVAPVEALPEPAPAYQEEAAPPQTQKQKAQSENIADSFEQSIRAEQERKQSYQILREQSQAHPGQLGTLTEAEIQKLEKEGETGDSGYP